MRSTWASASRSQSRLGASSLLRRRWMRAAEQLDVGAHDRERRAQGVRHDRHEVGTCLVDGAQALDLGLGLGWRRLFSTMPGEEAGERLEERDVLRA